MNIKYIRALYIGVGDYDFGSEEEEIIIKRKGKKIFYCAYARYLMFGVK
jgi:hypothetical protein